MKYVAIFFVRMYQSLRASFFLGSCRFHPTCSHYSVEAFETRGFFIGLMLTIYRIMRCQPFCKGGYDPVPLKGFVHRDEPSQLSFSLSNTLGVSLE